MALTSPLEWTDATWNPVTGCTKISPGCTHRYAERMSLRLQAMGQANYRNGFELTLEPQMLELPLRWRKPRSIFVNSMSDLFQRDVPLDYIQRVFDVMRRASWHRFQVLTKRAERLAELDREIDWPPNVWIGVSVESEAYVARIDYLPATHARVRFLSIEPLLGPLPSPIESTQATCNSVTGCDKAAPAARTAMRSDSRCAFARCATRRDPPKTRRRCRSCHDPERSLP